MERLLDRIHNAQALRTLTIEELKQLAAEVREEILEVVSKNGGHLSSNLGVVELTLALHYMFDTPTDKIIWDVSHQCYTHKLVTGRKDGFRTLRQMKGMSGFCKVEESPYDAFGTGHSSTSISAALGMAAARDLKGTHEKIIAVIGDGSMTGGLAYEALNNAGGLKTNLLVVLNSNEMSIARNVGAISHYVNKVIANPFYNKLKDELEHLVDKIPTVGHRVVEMAHKIEGGIKGVLVPGTIFEAIGFRYFGPVDGHNLDEVIEMLKDIKDLHGPLLFHVVTKKGKGYLPAEERSDQFHGIGPFELSTGKSLSPSKGKSFSDAFGQALCEYAQKDPRVVAITAAMPSGTGLSEFARLFPKRFFDVGIAEGHSVTFAGGLAMSGLRPVVAVYSTFLQRGFDHILHDVCLQNLPVIFGIDRAGLVGDDGPTHHGVFDISFLRPIPNLKIVQPRNEANLQALLKWAFHQDGPVAIRYPRGCVRDSQENFPLRGFENGFADVLRKGRDIALLAIGDMVYMALEVAELLDRDGISAEVIDARFIKPLDEIYFRRLSTRIHRWVTLEDHVLAGGFGSAVLEFLEAQKISSIQIANLGIPDVFVEHGPREKLWELYGLTPILIAERIKREFFHKGQETVALPQSFIMNV